MKSKNLKKAKHIRKIFVVGNRASKIDSQVIKLYPWLKKTFPDLDISFFDPTESLSASSGRNPVFIDTVLGIDKVEIFKDLSSFVPGPRIGVHDYDLYLDLALLKKIGKLKKYTIIGIPPGEKLRQIKKGLKTILKAT